MRSFTVFALMLVIRHKNPYQFLSHGTHSFLLFAIGCWLLRLPQQILSYSHAQYPLHMFSSSTSMNLLYGLHLGLFPGSSIITVPSLNVSKHLNLIPCICLQNIYNDLFLRQITS